MNRSRKNMQVVGKNQSQSKLREVRNTRFQGLTPFTIYDPI
jgi:hypothetical protein